ncbi:MAG: hypothetical protein KIH62_000690 [Candidatus Kerfeldbacteria bacterium]|nr:hypothetical protein [Candidatus Kerfeldbacteria bacterium]
MPKQKIEDMPIKKSAIVGRALTVAIGVFFFAIALFIAGVIIAAKFATRIR